MTNARCVDTENEVLRNRLAAMKKAVASFVRDVERYVEPKPGEAYIHRSELLLHKNNLKALIK